MRREDGKPHLIVASRDALDGLACGIVYTDHGTYCVAQVRGEPCCGKKDDDLPEVEGVEGKADD